MFLLPSIGIGFLFALLLGGRPSQALTIRLRASWLVLLALAVQITIFSRLGRGIPTTVREALHVGTYLLLAAFALANRRVLALLPLTLGMLLNALVVTVNGGWMPVTSAAAKAAGIDPAGFENVSEHAHRLVFLGDVFALPKNLPLSNTFSVGDLLISLGMVAFIVMASSRDGRSANEFARGTSFEPLRVAAYRNLIGGKLVSSLGDWLTVATVVGWIYAQTRSTTAVAATLIARLGPPIVGGGVAAYVVDRMPKGRLLARIEVLRGIAGCAALAGVIIHGVPLVLVALGISGALAAISSATTRSLTPALVPREQLPAANAGLGMIRNTSMAFGAGGAGLMLSAMPASAAVALDVGTFAIAAALFSRLRLTGAAAADGPARSRPGAWRHVAQHRRIAVLICSFATATFATGMTNTILPRFLAGHTSVGAGGYGFALASLGLGLAAGEAIVGFSRIGLTAGRWIGVGLLMTAGLFVLLAWSHHAPSIFLFLALIGFLDGSTDILYDLVIQREASPEYYGATFGLSSAVTAATMVGGFALAAPISRFTSPGGVVAVSAGAYGLAGATALVAIVRRWASDETNTARLTDAIRGLAAPFMPLERDLVREWGECAWTAQTLFRGEVARQSAADG